MKYSMFKVKVENLGDIYSVSFRDYAVQIYCKGEWVATVIYDHRLAYNFQQAWEGYWGSDELRCQCIELVHKLAETKPSNRGRVPADVNTEYQGLVLC
ncbi:hypothetical protein [uncultured Limosilactobacillus sp.]|uniref:hypothetical protein n=1 Tax=uncultured Limosilactobacillus sp. TaxID=2837629 RepID=UPI0025F5EC01|nr:hypothetical protein [uncultured Limosilactobacillus sp.]